MFIGLLHTSGNLLMPLKKRRTPQEKKQLSRLKDRRNNYGENDKSARKTIPRNKKAGMRSARRSSKQLLQFGAEEESNSSLNSKLKKRWRKMPDAPLGEWIQSRLRRRANSYQAKKKRGGPPNAIGPQGQEVIVLGSTLPAGYRWIDSND